MDKSLMKHSPELAAADLAWRLSAIGEIDPVTGLEIEANTVVIAWALENFVITVEDEAALVEAAGLKEFRLRTGQTVYVPAVWEGK
jgi:hypothetical protein